jgi:hypothetical protein
MRSLCACVPWTPRLWSNLKQAFTHASLRFVAQIEQEMHAKQQAEKGGRGKLGGGRGGGVWRYGSASESLTGGGGGEYLGQWERCSLYSAWPRWAKAGRRRKKAAEEEEEEEEEEKGEEEIGGREEEELSQRGQKEVIWN